jgi:hypothetical protein
MAVRRLVFSIVLMLCSARVFCQVAGQNINMVSGTNWPAGDPYLQRQNEPSIAVSSRNPEHLLGGANDYRTVDIPNPSAPTVLGDAWLGVYTSMDGGETWKSTLLPGYPQDTSSVGTASPLHQFTVATDPTVRAGTHGLFYYSGLVFNRGTKSPSGVFVATFQDQNNKGNGDSAILMKNSNGTVHGNPFSYINANLVDTGTSGQFLDKPWIAVDIPRAGRTATCKINGQTFSSGYVYILYTQFNGSQNNPASKIKEATSTDCGATWSHAQILSQSQKLAQGTVAAIDPSNGNVYVAWRQIASSGNQPDAIQWAVSTNGGNSFTYEPAVYTFVAPTTKSPYPPGAAFDQPSANSTTFRSLDVPALAVDANSRVWLAFSQRVNGPTPRSYGSRIMITTLPKGSTTWTTPYIADGTAPTSTYGHQFVPSLNFAYGKLALAWYDSRRDNLASILACPSGTCTDLSQLTRRDQPIPGSMIADPTTIFTPTLSDPNSGIRHTVDVFGGVIDPSAGPKAFTGFQISQYPFWVNPDDDQIEQGFFNPPNLPIFVQGTTPFLGDYIDIAAQSILPSGNSWIFNTQGKDAVTGATNAPDFHVAWTDNRDVVPPPVVNNTQDWTQYVPPNSGTNQPSTYFGAGTACPTCATTQPVCSTVLDDNGAPSAYSGDRNQNVYTSRITNGLVVRFRENAKPLSTSVQRSFSLLVKNTVSPLNTSPLGSPSYYRIVLGVTSTSQTPSCSVTGGTASLPSTPNCYLDVAINPKTTLAQAITINSSSASASLNVLVAQIQGIPASGNPMFTGLQALAVINGDPTNPSVADPDFLTTDNSNPDVAAPYGTLPIAVGETYDPTVDGPPAPDPNDPGIFSPKIGVPAVFSPKIGTVANNSPSIQTPTVFSPKIFSPKIYSVQVVNPKVVNAIFSPKIFSPKIFSPKIVSPEIFSPKITDLADSTGGTSGGSNGGSNPVTDYSWRVSNRGNTSASYSTKEFAKSAGVSCCPASCSSNPNSCQVTADNPAGHNCSLCQLVQHKVYESPTANRENTSGNPTCDLNVQQESIVVANITDPAFTTSTSGTGSAADPTNASLTLSPGEGNRVTLRVIAPQVNQAVSSFKTHACSFTPDTGQNSVACSLVIATSALPVAVVGQGYNTALSLNGGSGATFWSVTPDPTNPIAVIPPPIAPEPLPVSPLTLSPSGLIISGNGVVTASPGTYTINMQVQDSAAPPSLDPQQVPMLVNQFTISNVNVAINNEVGSTAYMKAGDMATVAVTISNQGPATATSIAPTLTVNPAAGGTPPGPTPVVNCAGPVGSNVITGGATGSFTFTCTASALSGNGYVTFTAKATGQYINSPAATVVATAAAVSAPTVVPSSTPPNVIVDTVAPILTFASATTAQSALGWYNTPVVIPFTATDNLSGVLSANATSPATGSFAGNGVLSLPGSMTLTTEGKLVTGVVTVTDFALNAAPFTSLGFNIDRTLPTITGAPDRAANANNWYNAPVMVSFICADPNPLHGPAGQQSGVANCTSRVTLSGEGTNQSVPGNVNDVAGNSAITTVSGINIDTTTPTISGGPDRPANTNNWYSAPVTVSFVCADPNPLHGPAGQQSGIANCMSPVLLLEGANQSVPGIAHDKAGNSAAVAVAGINIDQTPPVIIPSSTYAPGTWTNQSVTVTLTCTDNLSGPVVTGSPNPIITGIPPLGSTLTYTQPSALTSVATVTLTANTPGTTLNASCQDLAGNNAQAVSFGPIKIDTTPPTVTGTANLNSPTGPAYTAGTWTNQSVVVTFACGDSLSGVKPGSIVGDTTFGSQGIYTTNGSCQDLAGNTGNGSFGPVQIDTTTPGVLITSPVAQAYLLNQQITPNITCGDNAGGDTTTCTASPSALPYTANAVGPATFSVHVVDQAGNLISPDPSVSYLVIYNFTGFQAPLQPAVMLNPPHPATPPQPSDSGSFTIGTTIPIAWQLQDFANTYIADPTTLMSIVAIPNPACTGTASGTGTTLYNATTGQAAFSYDIPNNRFVFNWNTVGIAQGCYNLLVNTNDSAQWSTIVHMAADTIAGFDAPLAAASAPASPSNSGTFDTGSTVPIAWQLLNSSLPDTAQTVSLSSVNVASYGQPSCAGTLSSPTVLYSGGAAQGSTTYAFDNTDAMYTVGWNTTGLSAGCYQVLVTLSDQSVYATQVTLATQGGVATLLQYNFDNVPQGAASVSAPPSFAAPGIVGGTFNVSNAQDLGINSYGCVGANCIDVNLVISGSSYNFSIINSTTISGASVSFHEFNNDCENGGIQIPGCNTAQTFSLQYDTDPNFSSPALTTVATFTPPSFYAQTNYTFPMTGSLAAGTYYFRILATGSYAVDTAQYTFDNVTITGTH